MANTIIVASCLLTFLMVISSNAVRYQPTWQSLDTRPIPPWYDEVKIGIFMHWGVFSVPAFGSEWFWWYWQGSKNKDYVDFVNKNYPSGWTYADFAHAFRAEMFDPDYWADLIAASGAGYYVLTTKHHEGFCNWPTKVSFNWNSMAVGPNRDLVGSLATSIRNRTKVHFGIYHSMSEWFHPQYLKDKANKWTTQDFVKDKTLPELYELINTYKPEFIWSDGDSEAPDTYWNSTHFLAWLYNDSPVKDTIVVNDRWGQGTLCKHGDTYTCQDRFNPGVLQKHKWENAMTIDKRSWGFRRQSHIGDYLTAQQLINTLAETVSCGGNLLVNVGPTADGRILPIFDERMRQMGSWLKVNGEAIYKSKPWTYQNDTLTKDVWYTKQVGPGGQTDVYAITLKWPVGKLVLGAPEPTAVTQVTLVGYTGASLQYTYSKPTKMMTIHVPEIPISSLPCEWAWTFKMTKLSN